MTAQMYDAFYDPKHRWFFFLNNISIAFTILFITAFVLESVAMYADYLPYFRTIEYVAVAFFTVEFIARFAAHGKEWRSYLFSFYGMVDLLSIVPTYLGFFAFPVLQEIRILRVLKLLRLFRLIHLRTLRDEQKELSKDVFIQRMTFQIYFFVLFTSLLFFGSIMYSIEGHMNPVFANIPLSILWVTKPLLGGVAQAEPITIAGNIMVAVIRFFGLVLFGLLIGVIGAMMHRFLFKED